MANKKSQYLFQAKNLMNFILGGYPFIIDDEYIEIIENKAYKKPDAEKKLKEKFTFYAENSKQEKAVAPLQTIAKELEKLNELGINLQLVLNDFLFYLADNEVKINSKFFKSYIAK